MDDLHEEISDHITEMVLFGFMSDDEILEDVEEEFDGEDYNPDWVQSQIKRIRSERQTADAGAGDFRKLAAIFDELNRQGIIALHKAGYTKQDGYADVAEVYHTAKDAGKNPFGFCFYHTQDLQRAVNPDMQNLFLAFDSISQDDDEAITIGNTIVRLLVKQGFDVDWNGTIEQRIEITHINWDKLPDGEDWGVGRSIDLILAAEK